jgi:hypothetical protein
MAPSFKESISKASEKKEESPEPTMHDAKFIDVATNVLFGKLSPLRSMYYGKPFFHISMQFSQNINYSAPNII